MSDISEEEGSDKEIEKREKRSKKDKKRDKHNKEHDKKDKKGKKSKKGKESIERSEKRDKDKEHSDDKKKDKKPKKIKVLGKKSNDDRRDSSEEIEDAGINNGVRREGEPRNSSKKIKINGDISRTITLYVNVADVIKQYKNGEFKDMKIKTEDKLTATSFSAVDTSYMDPELVYSFLDRNGINVHKVYTNMNTRTNMTCDWCRYPIGKDDNRFGVPTDNIIDEELNNNYLCHGLYCHERCAYKGYKVYHKDDPEFHKSEQLLIDIYNMTHPSKQLVAAESFYLLDINGGNLTHDVFHGDRQYQSSFQPKMLGVSMSFTHP